MNGYAAWARQQELDGWAHARHAVLETLGERTDSRSGLAIATVEDLARTVGRSVREVQRFLEQLIRAGKLERIARFVPRQGANAYRLLTHWVLAAREREKNAPTEQLATATPQEGFSMRRTDSVPLFGQHLDHHPTL